MKMRRFGRLISVLIAVLLLCALLFPASGSSTTIYQMAVNERMKPDLTAENMPLMFNGSLYIPYTMLSEEETGIDLGVRAKYSSVQGILSVSDSVRTVNFNIRKNTAHASTGETIRVRAMVRNTMVYLPVQWLCTYFSSISYSLKETDYGILVRLTGRGVILNDSEFIDAAGDLMRKNMQNYYNSLVKPSPEPTASSSPSVSVSPSPSVSVSPSPTVSVSPDPTPSQSVTPSTSVSPTPSQSETPAPIPEVCLAFRWGDHTAEVADVLERSGKHALFLMPEEALREDDDLVRRLLGRGHQIGLILDVQNGEDRLEQLERGRRLMAEIACSPVLIVAADGLNRSERAAVRDAGCALWSATLYADGLTRSGVLTRLDGDRVNRVEITCDAAGYDLAANLLPRLTQEDYHLGPVLAPLL